MKLSDLSKFAGAGILAASLAVVPLTLPASAQTDTETTPRTDVNTTRTETRTDAYDNEFDWGWLGLLGLLGLAGLARKREEPVRYREVDREPDVTTRTGGGYPR